MTTNGGPVYAIRDLRLTREKNGSRFDLTVEGLEIRAGEFLAVVGESGSGKSALLDILALILRPTVVQKFTIRPGDMSELLDLRTLSEQERSGLRARNIGYILQNGGMLPFLSVAENIALPSKINRLKPDAYYISELFARLKIGDQARKMPHHLSGGQRQRAAIARALAHRPQIVLADEPTAAVDKSSAVEICMALKELASELGVTVVMVTHDTGLVAKVADRAITFELQLINENHAQSRCIEATFTS